MTLIPSSPHRSPRRIFQRAVATASVALFGVLSACGTVSSPSEAFSVNGTSMSRDTFNSLAQSLLAAGQFQAAPGATEISASDARAVLDVLVRHEATLQYLAKIGVKEDPAVRRNLEQQVSQDPEFQTYEKNLQDLLIDLNVSSTTLESVTAPSTSVVEGLYIDSPASSGVLCLSHILVKSEADARKALGRLDKGEKFADVAKAMSTEPGADKSGGALKNGEEDCGSLAELQKSFDPDFMAGAVDAKPGVPTGPVKSQFGYHVILSHPFDEVKDSVMRVVATNPGAVLVQGYLFSADISVNAAYGRWNDSTATIV